MPMNNEKEPHSLQQFHELTIRNGLDPRESLITKERDIVVGSSFRAHFDVFSKSVPYRSTDNLADDIKLHLIYK